MGDVIEQLACLVDKLVYSWSKLSVGSSGISVSRQFSMMLMLCVLLPGYSVAQSLPATEFVVPSGPVISLQDGQKIEGHIAELADDDVIIRSDDGTELTISRAAIDLVSFKTVTGMDIIGPLIGWKPGVYELSADDKVVTVYSMAPRVSIQAKKQENEQEEREAIDLVAQGEAAQKQIDEANGAVAPVVPNVIPDAAAATTNEIENELPEKA